MFWQNYFSFFFFLLLIGSGGFRKRKHDNFPQGQKKEEKENVNPSSPLMTSFKCKNLESQFVKMCVVKFARNYVFSVGISQLSQGEGEI